ncbi:FMN2, partial [Symbiodinium sp. CCMP2456]
MRRTKKGAVVLPAAPEGQMLHKLRAIRPQALNPMLLRYRLQDQRRAQRVHPFPSPRTLPALNQTCRVPTAQRRVPQRRGPRALQRKGAKLARARHCLELRASSALFRMLRLLCRKKPPLLYVSAHLLQIRQRQSQRDPLPRKGRDLRYQGRLERGLLKQTRPPRHLRQKSRPRRRVQKLLALLGIREERDLLCPDTKLPEHLQKRLKAPTPVRRNPRQAQKYRRPKAPGRKVAKARPSPGRRRRQMPNPPKMRPPPQ